MRNKFYRVCHEMTMQGLWYDELGYFTGLIHSDYNFCKNNTLQMPFDKEVVGWLSVAETLEELHTWFSEEDIIKLQEYGYFIFEFESDSVKFYDKFQHHLIESINSKATKKIILL